MLFINNKYTRWYYAIITSAQNRILPEDTYTEIHHIVPKSLGGNNAKDNLVALTAREHFICHWLLIKMVANNNKMVFALNMMQASANNQHRYSTIITSKVYENNKKTMIALLADRQLADKTKQKISVATSGENNPMYGKKHTADSIAKMVAAKVGKQHSLETREKMKGKRKPFSAETRARMAESARRYWALKNKGKNEENCLRDK